MASLFLCGISAVEQESLANFREEYDSHLRIPFNHLVVASLRDLSEQQHAGVLSGASVEEGPLTTRRRFQSHMQLRISMGHLLAQW